MVILSSQIKQQNLNLLTLSMVRAKQIFDNLIAKGESLPNQDLVRTLANPNWYYQLDAGLRKELAKISSCLANLLEIAPEDEVYDYLDRLLAVCWQLQKPWRNQVIENLKRTFQEVEK